MPRKTVFSLIALVFATLLLAPTSTALAGNNDHRVKTRLSGTSLMSGSAKYRERTKKGTIEQRFSVQVEDGVPGAILNVDINGQMLGIIVLDDLGFGELQFRSAVFIDDPGDGEPIPTGFPKVLAGDLITVGDMTGVFN